MKSAHVCVLLGILIVLSLSVSLTGCGGGSGASGPTGSMTFAVNFPPLPKSGSKVLPSALNSVVIDILDNTKPDHPAKVGPVLLNRSDHPGSPVVVDVPDVAVGDTLIKARGYAGLSGGGKLIIIASTTCMVEVNKTVLVSMTMGTTTTTIMISGSNHVVVGKTEVLSASATDIQGDPITSPKFTWASSDEGIATVVPGAKSGGSKPVGGMPATVTGVAAGKVTITVTDDVSGATSTLDMDVYPDIDEIVLDPISQSVNKDKTFTLTAKAFSGSTEITDVDFTFTSENSDVASVVKSSTLNNEATVTGVALGTTRIKVTQPFTSTEAFCDVTVTETGGVHIVID